MNSKRSYLSKMVPIAKRILIKQKSRFIISVSGIGFSIMLMMFIVGIYEGVKTGATGYVKNSPSEIWLCQKNSSNLLRSTSFLNARIVQQVCSAEGVNKAEGILRLITTAKIRNKSKTVFLFGFEPNSKLSHPKVTQGSANIVDGEIILDESFVNKNNLKLNDSISIQNKIFRIAGICSETNAIVAQFSFTTLPDAQKLLGFPNVVSFILIKANESMDAFKLLQKLKSRFTTLAVFNKDEFIQNNLEEMQTGVLPILWAVGILAAISGAAVISLMLFSSIVEKREEYATLKAIGASSFQLFNIVIRQSILVALVGYCFGLFLYLILSPLIIGIYPEINLLLPWFAAIKLFFNSLVIGIIGAILPLKKLSQIYPAEVFRA